MANVHRYILYTFDTSVYKISVYFLFLNLTPMLIENPWTKIRIFFPYPKIAQPTDFCGFVFLAYGLIFCLDVKNFTPRIFFSLP